MVAIATGIEELRTGEIKFVQDETHEPMTTEGELVIILESVLMEGMKKNENK